MVIAGIVAGGVGSRMGNGGMPKQFMEIGGVPIIIYTAKKFLDCACVDCVILGVHPEWLDYTKNLIEKHFYDSKKISVTPGGANRNATIRNIENMAKEKYGAGEDDIILTHDAVRPFLDSRIIEENAAAAAAYGCCDTVSPSTDTLVRSDDGDFITEIPPRKKMYQGQTPQSFKIGLFDEVYDSMTPEELENATDVCSLFFSRARRVKLVEGSAENFKITYPFDLRMADLIARGE